MSEVLFSGLGLDEALLRALTEEGYAAPTPIQRDTIPHALQGGDVLAVAPTGTGKTAAFTLPLLQRLARAKQAGNRHVRALILTPTRELALQVEEALQAYGRHLPLTSAVVMGGVNMNPQIKALRRGVDILVATPGRLLDLMEQGVARLERVNTFILDEADRMLDMGFIHDVKRIASKVPAKRQTLFFSATMPAAVTELANTLLQDPLRVEVAMAPITRPKIEQRVIFVDQGAKQAVLTGLLRHFDKGRVLVFARTKHRADRIVRKLGQDRVKAGAIHSNKTQAQRQRILADFTEGRVKVLVATDIVARGIDVDGISHVINFDLSDEPENHIHRIGRTARAGAEGIAISFCDSDEVEKLWQVERLNGSDLPKDTGHPAYNPNIEKAYHEFLSRRSGKSSGSSKSGGKSGGGSRRRGQGGQGGQNASKHRRGRRGRRPVGASA